MTTAEYRTIRLDSARAGTGPATWGQRAIWGVVSRLGDDAPRYNLPVELPVSPPRPVARVLADLTELLLLHDSLHTRFLPHGEDGLEQVVDGSGELPVEIRTSSAELAPEVSAALLGQLAGRSFDHTREWPLRVGLVESGGLVHRLVLVGAHTGMDYWGLGRLLRDLESVQAGETAESLRDSRPAVQPLEAAEVQASPLGRRRDEAARRYWIEQLTAGPRQIFRNPAAPELADDPTRRFPNALLRSPALAVAVGQVAEKLGVSDAAVLLGAVSHQLALSSGSSDVLFQVVVGNRFQPAAAATVSTVAQEALFRLTDADKDFADAVRRTRSVAFGAFRHAAYDKWALDREVAGLIEKEAAADHSYWWNDTRDPAVTPFDTVERPTAPLSELAGRTELTWPTEFLPRRNVSIAVDALTAPGALDLAMTADPAVISRTGMEEFLRGVEGLIVAEATALGDR
ncbi:MULTISPECIES: condensation domain-containing protein [Streptomyces]|uniref:Condensation domain-containing protein n=2 Tax=Streptomyces microflavus subgroup TaxID=1482601 RepID=A0A7H8MPK9_STRMI|nr:MULTISPECIES: condensation domain-containing protein [Streptomyces]MEE1729034.1 condensation domain-containing protein [Streptomyces sp. BE282]QKW43764.1 non-ribosomal peptide synthetase condensation domain protein [Streptomyces microflavus]QTA32884.1 condensation protein [Streptomyces sp. CA-256286]